MSFHIPTSDHALRPFIDVQAIADLQHAEKRAQLKGIVETRRQLRRIMKQNPGIVRVHAMVRTMHNDLVLIEVTPESSCVPWVFGSLNQFKD